ncbi:hypothetical protein [Shewanella sp. UCD-KL12]|uniref:hypothetical protein n=1 Tax=Shewanella sp. UCD-KL12 TaxID=1917163 RepID=UPI0009703BDD|nr:hypothetical protein [Shewanella sp. UCD-KL12]
MFANPEQHRHAMPPLITGLMVIWALIARLLFAESHLSLAHALSFYPLFAFFPLVILLHTKMIWQAGDGMERLDQMVYALIHCLLSFVVWTFALMLVNGNSFS